MLVTHFSMEMDIVLLYGVICRLLGAHISCFPLNTSRVCIAVLRKIEAIFKECRQNINANGLRFH